MKIKNALIVAMALVAAGCSGLKSNASQPVATINGQAITTADLEKQLEPQLQQLEDQHQRQLYETKRQGLEGMLQKRLLEAKAKEMGAASPDELVQREIASRIPNPTDAEIQAVYEQAVASGQDLPPIDQVRPDIIRFINERKMQGELMAYVAKLKSEQKVEILLAPYLPPKQAVEAKGPSKGPGDAPVTIVEFGDFQCPYCRRTEQTMANLLAAYPGKIRLVARDFPLPNHPLAPKAAEASHCADDQGKYWEMRDKLFGENANLELRGLKQYARDIGLDGGRFEKCLDSGEKAKVVAEHRKAGEALNVTGTPAFFVNGRFINGAQPLEEFKAIIDAELNGIAKK